MIQRIIVFICLIVPHFVLTMQKAVIMVPVADLLKKSAVELFPTITIKEAYARLAMGDTYCKRGYQALFNEVVEIIEERDEEVRLRLPHIIYYDPERNCYDNAYWTLRSNVIFWDDFYQYAFDEYLIPLPVLAHKYEQYHDHYTVVVLTMPLSFKHWKFSAGTRFIANKSTLNHSKIQCFFNDICGKQTLLISSSLCIWEQDLSLLERRKNFVHLLKQWANLSGGFIPYVYSGSSFLYPCTQDTIIMIKSSEGNPLFIRQEIKQQPYAGLDCSCLISRAAQICGLPYYYKDSTTIERNLKSLTKQDKLEDGDIIWFPGHVVIISDIKNNLVIEARGYASGFGKVHEISLHSMFKDIDTYDDLMHAYFNNKPLALLTRTGDLRYMIQDYKILSFASGLHVHFRALKESVTTLSLSK